MIYTIENLVNAVSWTLIHSLWQGLLLTVLAAAILILGKKASARLRYNLLCALLGSFLVGAIATFVWQMDVAADETMYLETSNTGQETFALHSMLPTDALQAATGFVDRNSIWVAAIWMVLFCIKCLGLFRGFGALQRLRNYQTSTVPEFWQHRFLELKAQLGINQAVAFFESRLATIPCASGIFRPMILVPAGLLTSLPQDQIEAILLHELAHVKRRDFLMNLVQAFVEAVFFFNPALLWLSSIIREERENCCDDMALQVSRDRPSLLKALLSVSDRSHEDALSAAFTGKKNSVLRRAKRLLGVDDAAINTFEKSVLAGCVLLFAIGVIACSPENDRANPNSEVMLEDLPKDFDAYDTELQNELIADGIIADTTGLSYKLSKTDFIVNGELQSAATHKKFKSKFLRYKNISATFWNWQFD